MVSQLVAAAALPWATGTALGPEVLHEAFMNNIRVKREVQFRVTTCTHSECVQMCLCRSAGLVKDNIFSPKWTVGVRINRVSQLAC